MPARRVFRNGAPQKLLNPRGRYRMATERDFRVGRFRLRQLPALNQRGTGEDELIEKDNTESTEQGKPF